MRPHLRFVLFLFALIAIILIGAGIAQAQTLPTKLVLGVGQIEFDVETPTVDDAQAQAYPLYVPADAPKRAKNLTVTCDSTSTSGLQRCRFAIAEIGVPETGSVGFGISAEVVAEDGTLESARATAPFVLKQAGPPAGPKATGMSVRPATP